MNYCQIGERIRKYRKAKGFSQELLAEKVGISVTHMSHIETGNTKLSLPVFVALANELEVQTDDLLMDRPAEKAVSISEADEILRACSTMQARILVDVLKATKLALDKYEDQ